jgi:putative photosynthetic complex assembly protein
MRTSPTLSPTLSRPAGEGALRAAAFVTLLLLAALVAWVAWVRASGTDIRTPDAPTVAERSLRFSDSASGSVLVEDARSGARLAEFHGVEGEASFLRGSLRALVRERGKRGIGNTEPFVLRARADGRLTLVDPSTGERLDLESFGARNAAVYARLLPAR